MTTDRMNKLTEYLLALSHAQASGYKCNGEIGEVVRELRRECGIVSSYESEYNAYLTRILAKIDGEYMSEMNLTNAQIFKAYKGQATGELYFKRCSGVSTSIAALAEMYDDVVYLREYDREQPSIEGKVVFHEGRAKVPRGQRPKHVIDIHMFEIVGERAVGANTFSIAHII